MADERDYSIWAQNAGTTAAHLIGRFFPEELSVDQLEEYLGTFDVIRAHVFEGTITLTGLFEQNRAAAAVHAAFPGSTQQPFPEASAPAAPAPNNVVPMVPPVPAVPAPAAPLPPPPAPPAAAQPGGCPQCGSKVYDNRAENVQRVANGQKARPAFKCSNQACNYLVWR